MTLFYDSKTKKIKLWVIIAFIVVPIILIGLVWIFGKHQAEHKKSEQQKEADIFN